MSHHTQTDWDGVYYHAYTGDYVIFDVQDNGTVVERSAFTGDELHEYEPQEFEDNVEEGNFHEIDPLVVGDPAGTLDDMLRDAIEVCNHGASDDQLSEYDSRDMEFAVEALRFTIDDERDAWRERRK